MLGAPGLDETVPVHGLDGGDGTVPPSHRGAPLGSLPPPRQSLHAVYAAPGRHSHSCGPAEVDLGRVGGCRALGRRWWWQGPINVVKIASRDTIAHATALAGASGPKSGCGDIRSGDGVDGTNRLFRGRNRAAGGTSTDTSGNSDECIHHRGSKASHLKLVRIGSSAVQLDSIEDLVRRRSSSASSDRELATKVRHSVWAVSAAVREPRDRGIVSVSAAVNDVPVAEFRHLDSASSSRRLSHEAIPGTD